ncbi:DUF1778 domain-containing protein [Calidifontibacter sp. DB0510]|uniref:DUF1778 domain-containing protein n=1 Tax=Metallococcus carri TaxID=1656884 RepID=A0A967EB04_9MICO|nr:DUF1778 domain-containing protein [Metallococcus carri]NHN56790.1 DUF1778 domain-containing protein [Metallococcus carri]NOP37833.1 DUF1778 domain-containing protein [Calidifontibacter sp. DB2511S]
MSTKTDRLNLRCSAATLETLKAAAEVQDQDLTSFILGAALDRARKVLAEDHSLRLTPREVLDLERALDADPEVVPQLAALIRGARTPSSASAK